MIQMGIVFSGSRWSSVCFFYVDGHAFPPCFGKFFYALWKAFFYTFGVKIFPF